MPPVLVYRDPGSASAFRGRRQLLSCDADKAARGAALPHPAIHAKKLDIDHMVPLAEAWDSK